MKVYQVLLIGFIAGVLFGYTWHYQASKNIPILNDDVQTVMLNGKIPAQLIEVDYEKIN